MARLQPQESDDFTHFKSERLRFVLCLVREIRLAFEKAIENKWIASLVFGVVVAGGGWIGAGRFFP